MTPPPAVIPRRFELQSPGDTYRRILPALLLPFAVFAVFLLFSGLRSGGVNSIFLGALNLSLVSTAPESYRTSLLDAAVEYAWFKGIVVVVAAGNAGPDTMRYPPANDPFAIVVGATDDNGTAAADDDQRAWFSSYGTTQDGVARPDLVAPGRRIVSTLADKDIALAREFPDRIVRGKYIRLSGTSASAPVVSGAAALLLQARPDLRPNEVKWLLQQTAQPAVVLQGLPEHAHRSLERLQLREGIPRRLALRFQIGKQFAECRTFRQFLGKLANFPLQAPAKTDQESP